MQILRYNLDVAKDNHVRKVGGRRVMVYRASSSAASISVAFDKGHQSAVALRFPAEVGREDVFDRVWLSHAAQPGEWVDLAFLDDGESLVVGADAASGTVVSPSAVKMFHVLHNLATPFVVFEVPVGGLFVLDSMFYSGATSAGVTSTLRVVDAAGVVLFSLSVPGSSLSWVPVGMVLFEGHRLEVLSTAVGNTTLFLGKGRLLSFGAIFE